MGRPRSITEVRSCAGWSVQALGCVAYVRLSWCLLPHILPFLSPGTHWCVSSLFSLWTFSRMLYKWSPTTWSLLVLFHPLILSRFSHSTLSVSFCCWAGVGYGDGHLDGFLFWVFINKASANTYSSFYEFWIFWRLVELLGHMVSIYLTLKDIAKLSAKSHYTVYYYLLQHMKAVIAPCTLVLCMASILKLQLKWRLPF